MNFNFVGYTGSGILLFCYYFKRKLVHGMAPCNTPATPIKIAPSNLDFQLAAYITPISNLGIIEKWPVSSSHTKAELFQTMVIISL